MVYWKRYLSPLGEICLNSDGVYLTALYFSDSKFCKKYETEYIEIDLEIFNQTIRWLDLYFQGEFPDFIPMYKIDATPFRRDVLDIVMNIPYGEVVTYKDIAEIISKKRGIAKMSVQAVGGAVGWNPICIIIPCHRVVGVNNRLVGYGGGIKNKRELLKLEGHNINYFVGLEGVSNE